MGSRTVGLGPNTVRVLLDDRIVGLGPGQNNTICHLQSYLERLIK